MLKRLPIIAVAALLCVFAYVLVTGIVLPQAATGRSMFIVSAVSLAMAAVAVVFALAALGRAAVMGARIERMTKSVDKAFAGFVAEREREAAANDERDALLLAQLARIDRLLSALPERTVPSMPDQPAPEPTDVVLHPATVREDASALEDTSPPTPKPAAGKRAGNLDTVSVADLSIGLKPIFECETATVAGYEAADPDDGAIVLPSFPRVRSAVSPAADREIGLVAASLEAIAAAEAAGRAALPVHVAVDPSVFDDRDRLEALLALLRSRPNAARFLVLVLPISVMAAPGVKSTALARLAVAGVRFASDGWPATDEDIEALWRSGVTFARIPQEQSPVAGKGRFRAAVPALLRQKGIKSIVVTDSPQERSAALAGLGFDLMLGGGTTAPAGFGTFAGGPVDALPRPM